MLPTAESLIFAPGLLQRPGAQSVEKPGCPLSGGRASDVYGAEKAEKRETGAVVPFPYGQLFQVHGSKLKLHPVCDLSQASVLRITHRVFFLGVREDPFNGFLSALVELRVACLGYLIQNPRKYPIHGLFGEPMPEVIAHRGKMRRFLLQGITEKPAIAIVCADFFRCPPQRGKAVQMLDQHHLEQHHRIDAGASINLRYTILPIREAIEIFHARQLSAVERAAERQQVQRRLSEMDLLPGA